LDPLPDAFQKAGVLKWDEYMRYTIGGLCEEANAPWAADDLFCPQTWRIFQNLGPERLFDMTKSVTNERRRAVLKSAPLSLALLEMLPAGMK
jgi:hypothetical protein